MDMRERKMNENDFKNPDGTYDGAAALAALSGLSKDEILWTWQRMKQLRLVEGKTSDEAKAIIAKEVKTTPWRVKTWKQVG